MTEKIVIDGVDRVVRTKRTLEVIPLTMGRCTHPEHLLDKVDAVEDLNVCLWGRSGRPVDKNKRRLERW